jgi:GntR family transcriptional regulator
LKFDGHNATVTVIMSVVNPPRQEADRSDLHLKRVDRREQTLLHEQVAADIRRAIAEGEAGPGDRIPQAKDLAAVLGVNTNTVLRALRMLRDEGLLELGRGRAIVVAGTPERGAVVAKAKELIAFARAHGYRRDELMALLHDLA